MELSYYPGCTLTGSARELEESFTGAAQALGVTLKEIPDWTCCGASSAHMVDAYLEVALPARDLLAAEALGNNVVAPCAACHLRLKTASKHIRQDESLKREFPFKGDIAILSGLEMFHTNEVRSALKQKVIKPLEGLRVVPYYGCLAVRPPDILEPDDPENPKQMDDVLELLGAEVLQWPYKTDCCGGSLALTRTDLVLKLSKKLLDMANTVGADAMVTMCPMCQANLDTRQADISNEYGRVYETPILYLTELIGVALGGSHVRSWFAKHMVSPVSVLESKGLL
jgi:heterodisulfide reductase subunit B2